jgi:hypothetical protein
MPTDTKHPTNTMVLVEKAAPNGKTYTEAVGGAWGVPSEAMAYAAWKAADESPDWFARYGVRTIGTRTVDVITGEATDTLIEES